MAAPSPSWNRSPEPFAELISASAIAARVVELGAQITRDYAARSTTADVVVIGVLKGSVIFVADLLRRLPISLRLAFVWAESYRQGSTSGRLELGGLPPEDELRGRRVLLVDDILDSGRTLAAIRAELRARGAQDVRTCVFLDKPARRAVELEADHVCFEVEDLFVVGYGLDHAGRYRNLPYVGTLKPHVLAATQAEEARP